MRVLVQIDLSEAHIALFDRYEEQVLALLPSHGATLEARVRSMDGRSELHLLHFPSAEAREEFRNDPTRLAVQELWKRCGARSTSEEVTRIS